jgi:hypothetical protein
MSVTSVSEARGKILDIDIDLARELIVLKAKDLGLDDDAIEQLDAVICAVLEIEDADPFIFPT